MPHQPPHFAGRGRFRPPHFMNGFHAANGVNGHEPNGSIEEKFAALTVREVSRSFSWKVYTLSYTLL